MHIGKSRLNLIIYGYGTFFKVKNYKSYSKIFFQQTFIEFQAYDYGKKRDSANLYCLYSKLMETFKVYFFFDS